MKMTEFCDHLYDESTDGYIQILKLDDENNSGERTIKIYNTKNDGLRDIVEELHKKEEAKEQIIFMNRMWVMQAVFEGLIFSFIVAIGVLIDLKWGLNKDISWLEFIVIFAVLLSSVWLSAIEARRYARTQIREVILSYYSYCC